MRLLKLIIIVPALLVLIVGVTAALLADLFSVIEGVCREWFSEMLNGC